MAAQRMPGWSQRASTDDGVRMTTSRRFIGGLVRLGLVVLAGGICLAFVWRRIPGRSHNITVVGSSVAADTLAAGDLRIYSADSAVDLILKGDHILAGLSPKTVAQVKAEMDTSAAKDTGGL